MNKLSRAFLSTFLLSTALLNVVFAETNYNFSPYQQYSSNEASHLQGYAIYVPAGITCNAVLSQEINSQNAVVGQNINAILTDDFVYNGTVIASSGSTLIGSVVSNKKAGIGARNGQTMVKFTTIRTPYNNIIPISAVISTSDNSGVLKGGTAKDVAKGYAKDAVIGAGAGAVLGTAMGALAGGSVGRGAIYGTALGAGLGAVKKGTEKGEDVLVPSNSRVTILFNQPITLGAQ